MIEPLDGVAFIVPVVFENVSFKLVSVYVSVSEVIVGPLLTVIEKVW